MAAACRSGPRLKLSRATLHRKIKQLKIETTQ